MSFYCLCALFVGSAVVGYLVIRQVPSLLHTPLMSGMNALSGITVLGALSAAVWGNCYLALSAIVLAMVNIVGGFGVTDVMLRMFKGKRTAGDD